MQSNTETGQFDPEKTTTSALCWAARIIPLTVAIPLVPWMFYVLLFTYLNDSPPFLAPAAFLSPIVCAVIAWRWHLAGGMLLSALAILIIVVPLILTGRDFLLILVGTVLLAGGILHLTVWRIEERSKRRQQS